MDLESLSVRRSRFKLEILLISHGFSMGLLGFSMGWPFEVLAILSSTLKHCWFTKTAFCGRKARSSWFKCSSFFRKIFEQAPNRLVETPGCSKRRWQLPDTSPSLFLGALRLRACFERSWRWVKSEQVQRNASHPAVDSLEGCWARVPTSGLLTHRYLWDQLITLIGKMINKKPNKNERQAWPTRGQNTSYIVTSCCLDFKISWGCEMMFQPDRNEIERFETWWRGKQGA